MRVLLIGAGAVASVISKYLIKDTKVSQIVCATKNIKRAKEFINTKKRKIKLISLDASKVKEIINIASKFKADLIFNASLPRFNENIMEAALQVKAHYQDLASNLGGESTRLKDLRDVEQLRFHKKFRKAKLVGLINTGVAPGITNLLAREAADKLNEVDEIRFRCVEEQKASEFIFTWSAETTLEDLTAPPLVYRNGRFTLTKPFENPEKYEFSQPFGEKDAFSIYGDEVATIPLFIKVKNVDFKSSGTDIEFSKALFRLGLFNKKPIVVEGRKIIPLDFFKKVAPRVPSPREMVKMIKNRTIEKAVFTLVVEVIGIESYKKIKIKNSAVFPDLKEISKKFPGATYISYPTGTAAYNFFKTIPQIKQTGYFGVFPPEALSSDIRKQILIELESSGIIINTQFSRA